MILINRTVNYIKKNGIKSILPRFKRYFQDKQAIKIYYKKRKKKEGELLEQKRKKFAYSPKISIIIPMYNTPYPFFEELFHTIKNQIYENWELCLADGSGKKSSISEMCEKLMQSDKRIKYLLLKENGGISANTNEALKLATGEFIMLADHDDLLDESALYECVKILNSAEDIDSIYTDEDKIDYKGKKRFEPYFKPDLDIEYLRCCNYICHLFLTRRSIALEAGGFSTEHEGAQDFDFILKCIERSRRVYHIPQLLYHWRCHKNSVAGNPRSKMYAYVSGIKAVQDHYFRCGIEADVEVVENCYGYYKSKRKIVLPERLSVAVCGEENEKAGGDISVLQEFARQNALKVDTYNIFTVSDLNHAIGQREDEYWLLIDHNIRIRDQECIYHFFEYGMDENISAVTGKICSAKGKLIQGKMILGLNNFFDYSFKNAGEGEKGYYNSINTPQSATVVDYRCTLIRKSIVDAIGGLDNELPLGLAIADYCLRAEKIGKFAVYNPYIQAIYQGKKKFPVYDKHSKEIFLTKWRERIKTGDAYYNRNLTLNKTNYTIHK